MLQVSVNKIKDQLVDFGVLKSGIELEDIKKILMPKHSNGSPMSR